MPNEDNEQPFFFPGKGVGYPDVCPDYMRLNPSYFRYLDKKIDYANSHGFQVFIETLLRDVGPYLKAYYGATNPDMSKNAVFQYIRYIFARYQANAVYFGIVHQDLGQMAYGLGPQDWLVALEGYYKRYAQPPFGQLVTTNINGSTYRVWGHTDKAPWLTMHQVGNIPRDHRSSEQLIEIFNQPNPLPAYNQEPWFVSDGTPEESRRNRSTMYSCLLNGGLAGVAYQAKGLSRGNRERLDRLSTAEPAKPRNSGGELWDMDTHPNMWISIKWRSANELRHAKAFIMTPVGRYQDLVPHCGFRGMPISVPN